MATLRTIAAHVATAVVTLVLVVALFGVRRGTHQPPLTQIPRNPRIPASVPTPAPSRPEAEYRLPAVEPPAIPADVLTSRSTSASTRW
jgi:hypothetical protein